METQTLKPEGIFKQFAEICKIPRPSKHEEKIREFLITFGQKHSLETRVDATGNILIRKPATPGMEDRKTVVLQSHIDMVCEQNNDVQHDFLNDPLETIVEGEWMHAKGTTLGADNGIGVATELALLIDDTVEHGPIECLFTYDEETGLTGASSLEKGFFTGSILLNLDSEDEGQIFIGCAGGQDSVGTWKYSEIEVPTQGFTASKITVKGLQGGHSGGDIHLGRANANKVLNRLISAMQDKLDKNLYLSYINGGNLSNAIPREAQAIIAYPENMKHELRILVNTLAADIQAEFNVSDPNMEVLMESEELPSKAIDHETKSRLILAMHAIHHGVYAMSQDMENLVGTSNNMASIKMTDGQTIRITNSSRSAIMSQKVDMTNTVRAAMMLAGATISHGDGYPGWKPNPKSEILDIARESYLRLYGTEPEVLAIHAGLECGLFLENYPQLDMISFGPTLREVHSPDEKMHIPSVLRFWNHLKDILKHIPAK